MSRNASGTYSLPAGQPVVTGTTISASTFNTLTSDVSTEITDSLSRSGKGGMSSALVLNAGAAVGTPDLSWTGDTDTGVYRIGANNFGLAANGAKVVDVGTAGIAVTGTFSVSTTSTFTGVASFANGTVGTPAINFTNDTGSGLYRIGANDIGFAVNGVKQLELTTAAATIVQPLSCSGTANVVGSFSVNTNKFNVTASSGVTAIAGSVTITSASVGTGLVVTGGTGANANGVTATAGATSGYGVFGTATGAFAGVNGQGGNGGATGYGVSGTGGSTAGSHGCFFVGGSGGGNGAQLTATGTYAQLNMVPVTATPTTLANGDMWIENVAGTWHFKIRMNGATSTIA